MRLRPAELALLATNLVPLAGVLVLDWSLLEVMLVVWLEAAAVLAWTSAKVAVRSPLAALIMLPGLGIAAGALLLFQLGMIILWFSLAAAKEDFFAFALDLPALGRRLAWAAGAIAAFHGYGFWARFLRGPERDVPAWRLALGPIAHVAVLQVVVMASAFLVRDLGQPTLALVLLVALKTVLDLGLLLVERRVAEAA